MASRVVECFEQSGDLKMFAGRLEALQGDFDLEHADLIDLGSLLARRFPAAAADSGRRCYEVIRVCIREKIAAQLTSANAAWFRRLAAEATGEGFEPARAMASGWPDPDSDPATRLECELRRISIVIDGLPKGLPKERFAGAVALFFNLLYLVRR